MKKNKMMRIASVLLVAVLISTCAISGTFAKYVTKVSGEDKARVAKWGVILTVSGGELFAEKYPASDEDYLAAEGVYSVESSVEGEKVVAPGTSSNEIKKTLTAKVDGAPEVAARYAIEGAAIKDIVLKAGTYTDYTQLVYTPATADAEASYGYTDTFTLEADYSPVKWNLTIKKGTTEYNVAEELYDALSANADLLAKAEALGFSKKGCSIFSAISILAKVASKDQYKEIVDTALGNAVSGGRNFMLEADATAKTFKMSYDFDANKEMGFEFALSWEWAFENGEEIEDTIENEDGTTTKIPTGIYEFDAADTFLGNWMAVKMGQTIEGFTAPTDDISSTEISAKLTASATQID